MTVQTFPIIADVQIFQPMITICANCGFDSIDPKAFIGNLCIVCKKKNFFPTEETETITLFCGCEYEPTNQTVKYVCGHHETETI